MPEHIIIDGNNLLFVMHEHAPMPSVGRETMVRVIERWAHARDAMITLVFDGPVPARGMADQMASRRLRVRFSAPKSADDVIVEMLHRARHAEPIRVVSNDTAIRHEAKALRLGRTTATEFVAELFGRQRPNDASAPANSTDSGKPENLSEDEIKRWMSEFGIESSKDSEKEWLDELMGE